MKYQFTTEGSKPQTKYHHIQIGDAEDILFQAVVSTPLTPFLLGEFLNECLEKNKYGNAFHCTVVDDFPKMPSFPDIPASISAGPIGLDSICRIISNIKPLKQKVVISICGEKKVYDLDADKLETLLKSLE